MSLIYKILFGCILVFITVFALNYNIPGPAIFPDEAIYGRFSQEIANLTFNVADELYSPLYPIILTPFMVMAKAAQSYVPIIFLNALLVSFSFVPLFLFSLNFFSQRNSFFLALIISLLPNSALSAFTWAEPLNYFLSYWLFYFFWKAVVTEEKKYFKFVGNFLGLLYLTKPTVMIPMLAIVLTIVKDSVWLFFTKKNEPIKLKLKNLFQSVQFKNLKYVLTSFVIYVFVLKIVLFVLSLKLAHKPMGYGGDFILMLKNIIPALLSFDFYNNILDQISYYVSSTFMFGLVFFIFNWKIESNKKLKDFYFFLFTMSAGLIAMYTLAFGKYNLQSSFVLFPYGRYLNLPIAFILILAFSGFLGETPPKKYSNKAIIFVTVFLTFLLLFKSPLRSVYIAAIGKSPELSGYVNIFFNGVVDYEFPKKISVFKNIIFALFYVIFFVLMFYFSNKKNKNITLVIFAVPSLIFTYLAFFNINNYMSSLHRQNNLVKYLGAFQDQQLIWDEHTFLIKQKDVIKEKVTYDDDFYPARKKYKDHCYYCDMILKHYIPKISKEQTSASIDINNLSAADLNEIFSWYFISGDFVFSHLTQYWRGRDFKDKFLFTQLQFTYEFNFVENSDSFQTQNNLQIYLKSPSHAGSSWNQEQLFGLFNSPVITGTKHNVYSEDFSPYFKITLPKGKYRLEFVIDNQQLPTEINLLDFNFIINKKTKLPIYLNTKNIFSESEGKKYVYEYSHDTEELEISFEKNSGKIWTISKLKIIPLQSNLNNFVYPPDSIFVSMKNFPKIILNNNQVLKQIKNFSDYYFVYKLENP